MLISKINAFLGTPLANHKLIRPWLIPAIIGMYFAVALFIIGAVIGLAGAIVTKGITITLSLFWDF